MDGETGGDQSPVAAFSNEFGEIFDSVVDVVPDPLFVLDGENRIERVNDAMVEDTGYERTELVGRQMAEIVPASEHDRLAMRLADLAEEGEESTTFETTLVTSDGALTVMEANVTARTDGTGAYAGSVGVLRDVHERKRRERDLELLKQVLTRVFRHNVRNELLVVQGRAEYLDERIADTEALDDQELRTHTAEILETADRLRSHSEKARLMEQVVETDTQYEFDIAATVEDIVATAREHHPEATVDVDVPTDSRVHAHPDISAAIEELVENAIEHASGNADVDIWFDERGDTRTLFIEDESGGLADHEITVLRRGTEHELEHSSGVGLWLVRLLVEYSDAEMIVHRTDDGTLMGIRFAPASVRDDQTETIGKSPLARAPAHVRELSPERFQGDTVIERVDALHQLEGIYGRLERTGGHAALLTGEPGIGKTTLVEQFCERLSTDENPPTVATGVCDPDVGPPYHAFRQVMDALPVDRDISELLAAVGSDSTDDSTALQQRKQALFGDIADQLQEVATDRPVVLVVEDMHWADRGTIDLFEYLLDEVGRWGHPVLFVGTYRSSDVERTHPVLEIAAETAQAGRGTVVELDPFGRDEVRSLLSSVLDVEELPASFVEAVHDHTGGTPLFVNELGRHLAETLAPLRTGADLPETLGDVAVPVTVESAISDRLDAVPEHVWPTLRLGAVLGTSFSFDELRVASDRPVDTLIDCINTLVQRDVWRRSADGVEFVHGVVREQTLTAIEADAREMLHGRVASAIEIVHEDGIGDHASRLATHYQKVGDHATAFEYHREAGDHATETYATEDAIDHYERALTLADEYDVADGTAVATLHADLGHVLELTGHVDDARDVLRDGLAIASEQSEHTCRLLDTLARAQITQSEFEAARETATRQRELAASLAEPRLEASAIESLGGIATNRSEYEQARELHEESLELRREIGDRKGEAESVTNLGSVAKNRREFDRARDYYEEALAIQRDIGDRHGTAKSLTNLGVTAHQRGEYDDAREYYEEALVIQQEIGNRNGEANVLNNLGIIAWHRGRYEQACEYYEESLAIQREIGDKNGQADILNNLGIIAHKRSEYEQAREYYEEALAIQRDIGDRHGEAKSLNNLGITAYDREHYERAREYYEESLETDREIGDRQGEARSLNNLGQIASHRGQYDTAREYFEASLDIRREIGDRKGEAASLDTLGTVTKLQGEYERTRELHEQSLEIRREIGDREEKPRNLNTLGSIARIRDNDERASSHLTDALEVARDVGIIKEEMAALRERGALARKRGEYDQAAAHLDESLTCCAETENRLSRAKTRLERTRLALARDDVASARETVAQAHSTFVELGASHYAGRATLLQGRIAAEMGSHDEAREQWRAALDTFEEVGAPQDTVETLQHLVETCREQGDDEATREWIANAESIFDDAPEPVQDTYRDWLAELG